MGWGAPRESWQVCTWDLEVCGLSAAELFVVLRVCLWVLTVWKA